jgi:carbamoyltransferase
MVWPDSAYRPAHPRLGALGQRFSRPVVRDLAASQHFYTPKSAYARERLAALRVKLQRGEPVYLLGIGPGGHNAGVALVEASTRDGVRLLANHEEERYSGIKHHSDYPELTVEVARGQLDQLGVRPDQIHACLASWNYVDFAAMAVGNILEELPASWTLLRPSAAPKFNGGHLLQALSAPARLGRQLGLARPLPIIGVRHHDNHATFSHALSPFAGSDEPVIVTALDGSGDDGAISLYCTRGRRLELVGRNRAQFDSLGLFYSVISSTQGGWTFLSSEGRYMGAAAWGDNERETNLYYRQLREIFRFEPNGQLHLNRALANWSRKSILDPYTPALSRLLGAPILPQDLWNPDRVLRVEDIRHAEITRERLDKAAATQLVFEDALFHIVGHLIRSTGSSRLVLSGGTALNCLANLRLLERFDEAFFERELGQANRRLQLWVPPVPSDAGVPAGAAYTFALAAGVPPGPPLQHAFYCGVAPRSAEIRFALRTTPQVGSLAVGDLADPTWRATIADLLAFLVADGGVVGLFQGVSETGPRALGHRSILANPCNPAIRDVLNQQVKFRELIRPLAPMATYAAARRWFELSPGAGDDRHNAYNYMVLAARARPEAFDVIPAVIHRDGTSRVQIVRQDDDPFSHAYLKAMGRRVGVEISVNTSLNVGGPIVQTPDQALATLKRARGLDALLLIGDDGPAYLAWHDVLAPPKDGGQRLRSRLAAWQAERGLTLV